MAQQFDNNNRGALFKNDRKESDSHPGYTGTINVAGVDYWLSAWVKEGNKGKFFSLSVKPKDAPKAQAQRAGRVVQAIDALDDDSIPFD